MKTFFVQTLGCKVNHYESDQIAELLRSRGLTPADADSADLRIINTCSVTTQAASQSRQSVRRLHRLPVLHQSNKSDSACEHLDPANPTSASTRSSAARPRILVTGCWATSNPAEAAAMPGVDAVLGHHHNLALELDKFLTRWQNDSAQGSAQTAPTSPHHQARQTSQESSGITDNFQIEAAARVGQITQSIEPKPSTAVNKISLDQTPACIESSTDDNAPPPPRPVLRERVGVRVFSTQGTDPSPSVGATAEPPARHPLPIPQSLPNHTGKQTPSATSLPLLHRRQPGRQRAYLKIQDGCDAHCTYCIIPTLRPSLWSKPIDAAVAEARALVDAGHVEIVLTGIFLGAYGQPTALRRRQPRPTAHPLGELVDALCTQVPNLRRLRLSSLEPGDLTPDLIAVLKSHPQPVPHFHLPLQSGSDLLLRRMNRQYTRDDFLQMIDGVTAAFDRPALTTDIVVGFPGEDDAEFEQTASLVRAAGFIHVHAFPYSPRPGTAAARWTDQFIHGPIVNDRIAHLRDLAAAQSHSFRRSFLGQTVEVIAERDSDAATTTPNPTLRHGRCERYFPVHFHAADVHPGDAVRVRVEQVDRDRTLGRRI